MVLVQRDPVTVRGHPFNAGLGFMVPASFMTGGGRRAARGGRTRGAGALSVTGYRGAHCSGKQTVLQREHKGHRARSMVNFPNTKPISTPRPVPWSAIETSPFVNSCSPPDSPAPAWPPDSPTDPDMQAMARP